MVDSQRVEIQSQSWWLLIMVHNDSMVWCFDLRVVNNGTDVSLMVDDGQWWITIDEG